MYALIHYALSVWFMFLFLVTQQHFFKQWLDGYELFVFQYRFNSACMFAAFIMMLNASQYIRYGEKHYDRVIFGQKVLALIAFMHIVCIIFNVNFYTSYYYLYALCLLALTVYFINPVLKKQRSL